MSIRPGGHFRHTYFSLQQLLIRSNVVIKYKNTTIYQQSPRFRSALETLTASISSLTILWSPKSKSIFHFHCQIDSLQKNQPWNVQRNCEILPTCFWDNCDDAETLMVAIYFRLSWRKIVQKIRSFDKTLSLFLRIKALVYIELGQSDWFITGLEDGVVTKESERVFGSGGRTFQLRFDTLIGTLISELGEARHGTLECTRNR